MVLNDPVLNPDPTCLKILQQKFMLTPVLISYKTQTTSQKLAPFELSFNNHNFWGRIQTVQKFRILNPCTVLAPGNSNPQHRREKCHLPPVAPPLGHPCIRLSGGRTAPLAASPWIGPLLVSSGPPGWTARTGNLWANKGCCKAFFCYYSVIFFNLHITKTHRLTLALNCRSDFQYR